MYGRAVKICWSSGDRHKYVIENRISPSGYVQIKPNVQRNKQFAFFHLNILLLKTTICCSKWETKAAAVKEIFKTCS